MNIKELKKKLEEFDDELGVTILTYKTIDGKHGNRKQVGDIGSNIKGIDLSPNENFVGIHVDVRSRSVH